MCKLFFWCGRPQVKGNQALAFELPEGSAAKLLDKRYVGREVSVAPYRGGETLQYLILDHSTDKTIVKY